MNHFKHSCSWLLETTSLTLEMLRSLPFPAIDLLKCPLAQLQAVQPVEGLENPKESSKSWVELSSWHRGFHLKTHHLKEHWTKTLSLDRYWGRLPFLHNSHSRVPARNPLSILGLGYQLDMPFIPGTMTFTASYLGYGEGNSFCVLTSRFLSVCRNAISILWRRNSS